MFRTIFTTAICCIAIFATMVLGSCTKHKADNQPINITDRIDYQGIHNCHDEENPYDSQIRAKLEGEWLWVKKACYSSGETTLANRQVILKFTDASVYRITESSRTVAEGTWTLEKTPGGMWQLKAEQPSEYIFGYLLICGDQLLFNGSVLDGCDYLYKRAY